MGNDGGKVGSNVGVSQRQLEKSGKNWEKKIPLGQQHRHKTVVTGRGPIEGVGIKGQTLNVGRRTGAAGAVGLPQKGLQRANVMNQIQSHLTQNIGVKANGMAGRGRNKVGFRTTRTSTRNPSGTVTGRVVAVGKSKRAALRAVNRGLGKGKNGLSRIGAKRVKGGTSYTKIKGGWRANVSISAKGSTKLSRGNSARRGKAAKVSAKKATTRAKTARPARSRGGQGARKTPARKSRTVKSTAKKTAAKKTTAKKPATKRPTGRRR